MAIFQVSTDVGDVSTGLKELDDKVRAALRDVETTLDDELLSLIEATAPRRTGAYVASLKGEVDDLPTGEWASVLASVPYASFIESGADIPPHEILPNSAQALSFLSQGAHVFAGRVQSPGGHVPAQHIMANALETMADTIMAQMDAAIDQAANEI